MLVLDVLTVNFMDVYSESVSMRALRGLQAAVHLFPSNDRAASSFRYDVALLPLGGTQTDLQHGIAGSRIHVAQN